jgi:ABC-type Mn2+/Zn2+ transport system permease subunit
MFTTIPAPSELLLSLAMAAAAGLIGSFAVLRRMTLASDAISHVALPGIGIAILLHVNPLLGGSAALLLGTLLVWAIEHKTRIPTEAIIGVVFSTALAIGSMLTSGEDLIEALFGSPGKPGNAEIVFGLVAASLVIVFAMLAEERLVIALVSPDLARTAGIDVARLNLYFLLAFALAVSLGLRFLGVLLMGSLIIIPAATAKHLARSLPQMRAIAVVLAMSCTLLGSVAASWLRLEKGPVTIAVAATLFFVSLGLRRDG